MRLSECVGAEGMSVVEARDRRDTQEGSEDGEAGTLQ